MRFEPMTNSNKNTTTDFNSNNTNNNTNSNKINNPKNSNNNNNQETATTSHTSTVQNKTVKFAVAPRPPQFSTATKVQRCETTSPLALRDAQVRQMNAGKKFLPTKTVDWPTASKSAIDKFRLRHPTFTTYTKAYVACQLRLLFLADYSGAHRFEMFEKICFEKCLAPTTAESYWTAWLSLQTALQVMPSEADARITKLLKARSSAYPVSFPTPATTADINKLVESFSAEMPAITAVIAMAFLLGQRISDMIQLSCEDLDPQETFLVITVRRGKTFTTASPYTLWLRRNSHPAEELIEAKVRAQKLNHMFLLTPENSDEQRTAVTTTIRNMLTWTNESLELRSIRRGGLHLMASCGHPLETIIKHSRHADTKMLMRYLNWGNVSTDYRDEMLSALDSSTEQLAKRC